MGRSQRSLLVALVVAGSLWAATLAHPPVAATDETAGEAAGFGWDGWDGGDPGMDTGSMDTGDLSSGSEDAGVGDDPAGEDATPTWAAGSAETSDSAQDGGFPAGDWQTHAAPSAPPAPAGPAGQHPGSDQAHRDADAAVRRASEFSRTAGRTGNPVDGVRANVSGALAEAARALAGAVDNALAATQNRVPEAGTIATQAALGARFAGIGPMAVTDPPSLFHMASNAVVIAIDAELAAKEAARIVLADDRPAVGRSQAVWAARVAANAAQAAANAAYHAALADPDDTAVLLLAQDAQRSADGAAAASATAARVLGQRTAGAES